MVFPMFPTLGTDIKNHLALIGVYDLICKIDSFRRLPLRRLSREEIENHIHNVLSVESPGGMSAITTASSGVYAAGTRFYRVRTLDPEDTKFPLRSMHTEADAWEPPPYLARKSRLNREGEPLLYTSPMLPEVAVEEMKIAEGANFSLIVYEAVEDIKVTIIGQTPIDLSFADEEKTKIRMINDFLCHEFTRDVGVGTEFLYDVSEIIAKTYFDLPPTCQDAWCYPSIAARPSLNVCFRPEVARAKLNLLGVQIANFRRTGENYLLNVKCIAAGFGPDGTFLYHMISSNVQKQVFPEIEASE